MKGLAEFAMRGRFQALLLVLAGAGSLMFCWISAALVALVTLRKGAGEGARLLMWALLPAGVLVYTLGDSGPLSLLAGAMVLALVLRSTTNLALAVLAAVPVGVITGLALLAFGGAYLEQLALVFDEFLGNMEQQLSTGGNPVELLRPTSLQIAGMLGTANASLSVLCLFLARYWQAALYNPGGFGEEFRALYLPPAVTMALALVAISVAALGIEYRTWAVICLVPISFAGLALAHARFVWRGHGTGMVVGFYLFWLFFDPVKMIVVFAAIADSWFNFRRRWNPGRDGSDDGDENK